MTRLNTNESTLIAQIAAVYGLSERTVRRWRKGTTPLPEWVRTFLILIEHEQLTLQGIINAWEKAQKKFH